MLIAKNLLTREASYKVFGTHTYEVRSEAEYFDEIQDVKVTKDMLDLAKHIVNQKGQLRAREIRGPLRNCIDRSHQPEAQRQADHSEGAPPR